jgi:hypothetical protein
MNPVDWFLLGTRLLGVWVLIESASYFASWVELRFEFTQRSQFGRDSAYWTTDQGYLVHAIADLLIAIYLLQGTHLASLCYRTTSGTLPEQVGATDEVPAATGESP